ncbi:MAG: cyclic nucleotide-binding domain-containing protein, partial [candidate division NC10 bacterium]|nr:cyclic nucleotide-binding domain-containing protein [candidate division NC10 bacterium]
MKDGEIIVEDGTLAFYAYVLKSGKAKVLKDIEGRLVVIGTLHAGDVFGDMAFLGGEKRTASVIADGNVEVEVIGRDTFMEALEQLPQGVREKLEAMVST